MKGLRVRYLVAVALLSLPYVWLFAAGSLWLYEYHMLVWWFVSSLAVSVAGWELMKGLRSAPTPPVVRADPRWPPAGAAAWDKVEALAVRIEAEDLPLDQPLRLWTTVREVIETVARHYHPAASDPWLETPLPHVMRIVEMAARDLRQATMNYVPGAHIFTIRDWQRLWELAGWANRSYFWYRIVSFLVNTPAAVVRESRDLVFGKLKNVSVEGLKRWAVGFFVRRIGYYAIELYGGHLCLSDDEGAEALTRQTQADVNVAAARRRDLDKEPLRFLVVGQLKAGKSSLINALFGAYRAATDVVPRTRRVEPYLLERDGLQQAVILDTAGYDQADPADLFEELKENLLACDVVLCVCAASSAARNADRMLLDAIRGHFQGHPGRHMPVVIVVLTKIDQLRPWAEWNPPYGLCPPQGPKAEQIAAAVQAVAEDLAVPLGDVVPVCLAPERCYNVDEALVPAILERLPEAGRVRYLRCLRQHQEEQYWRRLWQQSVQAGRVLIDTVRGSGSTSDSETDS